MSAPGPEATPPNLDQVARWNEVMAPKFLRFRDVLVAGMAEHGRIAFERHPVSPGERVLDVGCGFGDTTIDLARRVGPAGDALGVDVCAPFLAVAREDASRLGSAARFRLGDAQTEAFGPELALDLCFSRFGTMFFGDPVAAMTNLRAGMKPGGRLVMLVWRALADNDWTRVPKEIVSAHLPAPAGAPAASGPGPYSMADPDLVRGLLARAGWTGAALERIDAPMLLGRSLSEAVAFATTLGPGGAMMSDAGDLARAHRPAIEAELASTLRRFETAEGVIMPSSSWCVTADAAG
jgi:ubiquinone/menaquinone biosynthesis C-methylase UbiE